MAAAGHGRLVVLTLAYSGLRWGELAALRVRDVDLLRGRLRVRRPVTEVNGCLVWTTPKDNEARSVPVPAFLRHELEQAVDSRGTDDLLFPAPRGGVLRVRSARRAWFDAAVTAAGLRGLTPQSCGTPRRVSPVGAGANVLAVQRMLGHEEGER